MRLDGVEALDRVFEIANTARRSSEGVVDDLVSPAAASAWMRDRWDDTTMDFSAHAHLIDVRDAVREILDATASAHAPPSSAVRVINDHAYRVAASLTLEGGRQPKATVALQPSDAAALYASALVLAVNGWDPTRVQRCAASGCVRFFYDSTRNRSRRWCSMETCGNRAKVRSHYRRSRSH